MLSKSPNKNFGHSMHFIDGALCVLRYQYGILFWQMPNGIAMEINIWTFLDFRTLAQGTDPFTHGSPLSYTTGSANLRHNAQMPQVHP